MTVGIPALDLELLVAALPEQLPLLGVLGMVLWPPLKELLALQHVVQHGRLRFFKLGEIRDGSERMTRKRCSSQI